MLLKTIRFNDNELKCRCGCGLLNYDHLFLMKLEVFRYLLGGRLKVNSGCRCKQHNANVGGVESSLHIADGKTATAIDIVPIDTTLTETFIKACQYGIFNEVIYYKDDKFIHLGVDYKQLKTFYHIK